MRRQGQDRWIDGIELLRAVAVILVVISHGIFLTKAWNNDISDFILQCFEAFMKPGWWGVRIFFAISGYLIASQSIKVITQGRPIYARNFAMRRWIRTVPTYWIFLISITAFEGTNIISRAFAENALFTQTAYGNPSIIPVAWSLVIEEWSYAIVSLYLMLATLFTGSKSHRKGALIVASLCIALLAIATLARYNACLSSDVSWETLKKNPILQIDALSMGMLTACIQVLFPKTSQQVFQSKGRHLVMIAIIGMNLTGYWINKFIINADVTSTQNWLLLGTIIYPISSILSATLMIGCFDFKANKLHLITRRSIHILATTSYSTYLIHLYVLSAILGFPLIKDSWAAFWAYLSLSLIAGITAFLITERPFLSIRKRLRTG